MVADWGWDLFKAFLGAGAGTATVTFGLTLWREKVKRRADATYLALRLAVALEGFAGACADLIRDNQNAEPLPGEAYGPCKTKLPALAEYPEDGDGWKALDANSASACLHLRNQIAGSQSAIILALPHFGVDVEGCVQKEAIARALEAHALAVRLRQKYGLAMVTPAYDYVKEIVETKQRTEEAAAEWRKRSATMFPAATSTSA